MADIIGKIGKYFAEQEAQLRQVYAQHTTPPISSTVHRNVVAAPPQTDALPSHRATGEHRPPSLLRRRLLLSQAQQSSASADMSNSNARETTRGSSVVRPIPTAPPAASTVASVAPVAVIPPLALSLLSPVPDPKRPTSPCKFEAVWSEADFASWRSARSSREPTATPRTVAAPSRSHAARETIAAVHPEVTSSDDDDSSADDLDNSTCPSTNSNNNNNNSSRSTSTTSRNPLLKRKSSSIRKKKRRSGTKPLRDEPSVEQLKRENEEKVAVALVLAQERARRIRAERELALKNQELVRHGEQRRVQDEMDKIEALRRKSKQFALRLRVQSAPMRKAATPRALSFLDTLERQQRDRMMLTLQIREKRLTAQRTREQEISRLRAQLAHHLARTDSAQQRVAALEATKASLTLDLAKVDDERQVSRAHWRELDDASRKERAQRQRDAEKQLRARVRSEEWRRLTGEEKARADVAADARVRAEQRVHSRAARLKKQLRSDVYESSQTRRSSVSNNNRNNDEDTNDDGEVTRILGLPAPLTKVNKTTALLLPPELAEFEEAGLLDDSRPLAASFSPVSATARSANELRHSDRVESTQPPLSQDHNSSSPVAVPPSLRIDWHVPPFEDRALFDRLLFFAIPSP